MEYKCKLCSNCFYARPYAKRIYCSRKCSGISQRKPKKINNKVKHSAGYFIIYEREHPNKQKRKNSIYEHRLIASQKIGRPLISKEEVHHINHDKSDNRPENLQVLFHGEHMRIENGWQKIDNKWIKPCTECQRKLLLDENFYKRKSGGFVSICKQCARMKTKIYKRKIKML